MNTARVFSGVVTWSLGLGIPLLYHALLMQAAVQEEGYIYSYHNMARYFFDLPWVVWPYLIAMAIVGGCLVISGLRESSAD